MRGNTSATSMLIIGTAVSLFIGIWVLSLVGTSMSSPISTFYVSNETNTSAIATGTTYTLATASGYDYTLSNTTILITNSSNAWTTTNYTAYDDGTITFGTVNAALLGTAYFSYEYTAIPSSAYLALDTASNTTWSALELLAVGMIIMSAMFILAYFGFGFRKQ